MDESLLPRLEAFCAAQFPEKENVKIEDWRSIQGGWESEIYAFDLFSGSGRQRERLELVLRLYSGSGASRKAVHEFRAMRQLQAAGYPVPRVYGISRDDSPADRPYLLMDHIQGESLRALMTKANREAFHSWLEVFCALFVRLHRLDWHQFEEDPTLAHNPYRFVDAWLRDARQTAAGSGAEEFSPLIEWIAERRDRLGCARPAPLHQDFHPDNILIRPDDTPVVIDWTSFTISDPRFDLAWTLVLMDAYRGEEFRSAILLEYERQAGAPVAEIDTFEVTACARRLYDIAVSLGQGAEERGMRPEAVQAMKRDMPATRRVYQRLVRHTGIRLQRMEELLEI